MALDYLRQYAPQGVAPPEPDPVPALASAGTLESVLSGTLLEVAGGACLIAETVWGLDHRHGLHEFGALPGVSPDRLALITRDPELAYTDLASAVFLDTETTGLSTGAGTYVFLVGAGHFDGQSFKVTQFFLRSPGEELPFLAALHEFLQRFSVLVTFNGKSFDWPLLESRFVRERRFRRAPLEDPLHLDLLHPARRLWKRRLESCALSSLEERVLQVRRTGEDVPGWLIPSLYFRYLRTGDAAPLRSVFYHNLHDILSLATLAIHIDAILSNPMSGIVIDGLDFLCLGKLYERAGDSDSAVACYEEALRRELSAPDRAECLTQLSACLKREHRWDAALQVWERLIDGGGDGALHGLIERAKYYEHVERAFMEALEDVQQALQLAELRGLDADGRRDLEHRQARLLNRVFQQRSRTGRR